MSMTCPVAGDRDLLEQGLLGGPLLERHDVHLDAGLLPVVQPGPRGQPEAADGLLEGSAVGSRLGYHRGLVCEPDQCHGDVVADRLSGELRPRRRRVTGQGDPHRGRIGGDTLRQVVHGEQHLDAPAVDVDLGDVGVRRCSQCRASGRSCPCTRRPADRLHAVQEPGKAPAHNAPSMANTIGLTLCPFCFSFSMNFGRRPVLRSTPRFLPCSSMPWCS